MAEVALSADKGPEEWATNPVPLDMEYELGGTVYEGSHLMWVVAGDTHLVAATATAASQYAGVALEGGVSGDRIKVRISGMLKNSVVGTITNAHMGVAVYANGDGQLAVANDANQQVAGTITNIVTEGAVGTNVCWVTIGGQLTLTPGGVGS